MRRTNRWTRWVLALAAALALGSPAAWAAGARWGQAGEGWGMDLLGPLWARLAAVWQHAEGDARGTIDPNGGAPTPPGETDARGGIDPNGFAATATEPGSEGDARSTIDPDG